MPESSEGELRTLTQLVLDISEVRSFVTPAVDMLNESHAGVIAHDQFPDPGFLRISCRPQCTSPAFTFERKCSACLALEEEHCLENEAGPHEIRVSG